MVSSYTLAREISCASLRMHRTISPDIGDKSVFFPQRGDSFVHLHPSFFMHLTEVLGARIFLPPVCMLLVDKVTNRASRQTTEEAQSTLSLPTSLLRHFDRRLQLFVRLRRLFARRKLTICCRYSQKC